jgi:hypothetical protein
MCNFKIYVISWIYYLFIPFYEEIMDLHHIVNESNISGKDICSVNSATTHTILIHKQFFSNLRMMKAKVNTISNLQSWLKALEEPINAL